MIGVYTGLVLVVIIMLGKIGVQVILQTYDGSLIGLIRERSKEAIYSDM